jgi:hypothetical protein
VRVSIIYRPYAVLRSPPDRILDRQFSSNVNADAIDQRHELPCLRGHNVRITLLGKIVAGL